MQDLWNRMKGAATSVAMQAGQNRWAIVANVRPSDEGYDVKVVIQPENVASSWIPVLSQFGGSGWGIVARPSIGMPVMVVPDTGDGHHVVAIGMAYSTANPAPKPPATFGQTSGTVVDDGEIAIVSKAGAVFRMCTDGTVYVKAAQLNVDGDLVVQGNITAQANKGGGGGEIYDKHGLIDTIRQFYNIHLHPNGGKPVPQIPE